MKIESEVIFKYKTEKDAKIIYNSLEVDNEDYLKSKQEKNKIIYSIDNEKPGSFLSTVDDLIASEIVAEKIVGKSKN